MPKPQIGAAKPGLTEHEVLILRTAITRRIAQLKKAISECAGTLYPTIYSNEVMDLSTLFEKITGQPLKETP